MSADEGIDICAEKTHVFLQEYAHFHVNLTCTHTHTHTHAQISISTCLRTSPLLMAPKSNVIWRGVLSVLMMTVKDVLGTLCSDKRHERERERKVGFAHICLTDRANKHKHTHVP